jgi:ferritin-like metal-binding protein YciE
MEKDIENNLEGQVKHTDHYPDIQSRIQMHLDATRSHAERVKDCIERNGGDVSKVKAAVSNLMGSVMGAGTGMAKDTLIKDVLSDFATENFEIASYRSIVDAANLLGDTQTALVCEEIIREEQQMAQFLHDQLPLVTRTELQNATQH